MLVPLLFVVSAYATELDEARAALAASVPEAELAPLMSELERVAGEAERSLSRVGDAAGARERVYLAVAQNLREKQAAALPMSADAIRRTVIGYEGFKLSAYVEGGVFPKRYFGYLDGQGDTAAYEARLERAARASVEVLNAWQAEQGRPVRVSEQEVIVTFLAEGGAWFLGDRQDLLGGLHPVFDVGLDNVASGLEELPELRRRLDAAAGTDLDGLVAWVQKDATTLPVPSSVPQSLRWLQHSHGEAGPFPYLTRLMRFEEAVEGTALMYLWEKEIAAEKIKREGWAPMMSHPLDEQFIIGSLVYNSGLVFGPERWAQIRDFSTGDYLWERSEANARSRDRLNLLKPGALLQEILPLGEYREQPTSWNAVYHVMQRYGAFVALTRFGELFDPEGRLRALLPEAPAVAPAPLPGDTASAPLPEDTALPRRWPLGWIASALLAALIGWRLQARRPMESR